MNDHGRVQFGYVYSPTQWGRGYATEVCRTMMDWLRNCPAVREVRTFTDAENVASARVLIKSGLIQEGRVSSAFRFVNQGDQAKDCIRFRLPLEGRNY